MHNLSDFLGRYINIGLSEKMVKESIAGVLTEVFEFPVTSKHITMHGTTAQLSLPASLKWAIQENKHEVLQKIRERIGSGNKVQDIR